MAEVASRLGRHRSTIYLDLARNRFRDPNAIRDRRRDMSGYYLTRRVDLELQFNGCTTMHEADPGTSSTLSRADGAGELMIRGKVNLFGNDGGSVAMALIPYSSCPPLPARWAAIKSKAG